MLQRPSIAPLKSRQIKGVRDDDSEDLHPTKSRTANVGTWSVEEDSRLRHAVSTHGKRWTAVAAQVGTRNAEQCAKRWKDNIDPDIDHSPWSADDDKLILDLVSQYGRSWKCLAENFPKARAPLSLKNRYALLLRRKSRERAKQQLPRRVASVDREGLPMASTSSDTPDLIRTYPASPSAAAVTPPQQSTGLSPSHRPCANFGALLEAYANNHGLSNSSTSFGLSKPPPPNMTMSLTEAFGPDNSFAVCPQLNSSEQSSSVDLATVRGQTLDSTNLNWAENGYSSNADLTNSIGLGNCLDLGNFFDFIDLSVRPVESGEGTTSPTQGSLNSGGGRDGEPLELSVTCSRSKLKAMVCHAFEGLLRETAGLSDEDTVTVALKLGK
ncbi:hypothetical protein BX600DRAFT_460730 [Xylariales sp. PMI_506]|nr:hypothetical protein BX600DRAFT_460730 [Xylariales sp. PMI_506]